MVQWLGLHTSTAGGTGWIPSWEVRSYMLHSAAKKKKKKDVFKLELYIHSKQINYKCRMRKFSDIQVSKLYLQNTLL